MEPNQAIHDNYFVLFFIITFVLCYWYDKKLELRLLVITILFKTEFDHLLFVKS